MANADKEIIDVKNENYVYKIKGEIDCLKKGERTFGLSDMEIGTRIDLLENLLINKEGMKKRETIGEQKDNIFKEIDKYTYKKPWTKLLAFHKIVKIKEFVKEKYGDGDMQGEIVTKLSEFINDGKINTKKFVVYDPNMEKILSMSCLVVDTEGGVYKINF